MTKRKGTYGAYPRNHPKAIRWMVDQDYVAKLSQEEREWLAAFNDRYYGADFRGDDEWSPEEKREAYRRKNAANADLLTRHREMMADADDPALEIEVPEQDLGPLPVFLSGPRYQGAVAAFRSHLKEGRASRKPEPSEALEKARAELESITHGTTEESPEGS